MKKYNYEPLAVVMREHSAADVASAIELHGCFGFDLFGRFKKLNDTEKAAVLDIIASFYRHEQEWFDNPESFDPEYGLEDSPERDLLDAPSNDRLDSSKNHRAWKYGWPLDQLPKFGSDSQEIGADDTAAKKEAKPKQETDKPWLIADPTDPDPKPDWYIPARYFARQLVKDDSTLLTKRRLLADKVVQSLSNVGIKKRGGTKPFDPATVLKAFSNVNLG